MADLRKPLLRFFVVVFASLDFAMLGWQIPSKEGMGIDVWAISFCLFAGAVAVWAILRIFEPKSRSTTFVWVGIVMVISSVIHPVFESAKSAARRSGCFSNLEALSLATIHYASDYDDQLPPSDRWRSLVEPYIGESPVKGTSATPNPALRCPEAKSAWTYGFNSVLSAFDLSKVPVSSETAMIFDIESDNPNASGGMKDLAERHGDRGGITFADGHVQFRKGAEVRWKP